jgi:hypothetical protein
MLALRARDGAHVAVLVVVHSERLASLVRDRCCHAKGAAREVVCDTAPISRTGSQRLRLELVGGCSAFR